jgi:hypothetical protein
MMLEPVTRRVKNWIVEFETIKIVLALNAWAGDSRIRRTVPGKSRCNANQLCLCSGGICSIIVSHLAPASGRLPEFLSGILYRLIDKFRLDSIVMGFTIFFHDRTRRIED